MHHTVAYTVLLGTTANTDIAALTDDIIVIQNGHFFPQEDLRIVAAWAGSATLNRVRIVAPTSRQITLPFIRPIQAAVLPAADANMWLPDNNPFVIRGREELAVEATSDIAMGTERFTAVLFLEKTRVPIPSGNDFVFRGTSTTAAVANAWTSLTTTWADTLPDGEYAITSLEVQSTNAIAARLILEGQYERPGSMSVTALGNRQNRVFTDHRLGVYGYFKSTRMPIVQVLANAADAAHVVHLGIMRLR